MTIKSMLRMTTAERAVGRYLRAPDHDASTGGNEQSDSSAADDQGDSKSDKGEKELTTSQKLEKEFGQPITPTDEDDSESGTDDDDSEDDIDEDEEDEEEGDEDAEEGEDDAEESEDDKSEDAEPKKKNRAQERIDELTSQAREAEREAAKWKEAAAKAGVNVNSADDEDVVPEEPDASEYKYGENDLDFIRDRAKYDATIEVLQKNAQVRFKAESASLEAKWTKNLSQNSTKYSDFDEVVIAGAKEEKWQCPPVIAVGIKDSDYGVDIAYNLAKNPEEAARISKLSPLEQAREFGRMEQREETKKDRAERRAARNKAPVRVSKAPTPPRKQVRGSGGRVQVAADTDDFAAFDKMADRILKKRA